MFVGCIILYVCVCVCTLYIPVRCVWSSVYPVTDPRTPKGPRWHGYSAGQVWGLWSFSLSSSLGGVGWARGPSTGYKEEKEVSQLHPKSSPDAGSPTERNILPHTDSTHSCSPLSYVLSDEEHISAVHTCTEVRMSGRGFGGVGKDVGVLWTLGWYVSIRCDNRSRPVLTSTLCTWWMCFQLTFISRMREYESNVYWSWFHTSIL